MKVFVILLLIRVLKRLAAKEMSKLSTNENKKKIMKIQTNSFVPHIEINCSDSLKPSLL